MGDWAGPANGLNRVLQKGPDGLPAFAASPEHLLEPTLGGHLPHVKLKGAEEGSELAALSLSSSFWATCPLSLSRGRSLSIEPKLGSRPAAVARERS